MKLNVKYTHVIEIALIPIILYILLIRTNIITSSETFIIICIGTIAAHLVLHIILKYYGIVGFHTDESISSNIEIQIEEGFSDKLTEFKKTDNAKHLKYDNRKKLHKKRKSKKNKKGKKTSESFSSDNIVTVGNVKEDAVNYYNSFNEGIMKKKSKSTGESIDKFYFLKDKLFEIFDAE